MESPLTSNSKKEKKTLKIGNEKGREKTLSHLASCLRKGRGGGSFYSATVRQLGPMQYWTKSALADGGGVLFSALKSTPVLQGCHHSVHYCVRLRKEEKKRGSWGGEENLYLCVRRTHQESGLWIHFFVFLEDVATERLFSLSCN